MQYLLLIYGDESSYAATTPEQGQAMMAEYYAYTTAIREEGVNEHGNALEPSSTARVVRVRDGNRVVTDGPYAETREQLGGYYLIDCDSEEQAIDVAARCPGAKHGTIELRPVMVFPTGS